MVVKPHPNAILPLWDTDLAVAEITRVAAKGFRAVTMPELPHIDGLPSYHDGGYWAPVFAALSETGLVMNLHIGQGFGVLKMAPDAVANSVFEQVEALGKIAESCGAPVVHVKPHGALYNQAVKNRELADAIARGVALWRRDVVLVGLAGSSMLKVFQEAGLRVAAEAFADRRYEPDGTLRSRKYEDALIRDPQEAGKQALSMVKRGVVTAIDGSEVPVAAQTICIHGDTPGATKIAAAVAQTLRQAGVALSGLVGKSE